MRFHLFVLLSALAIPKAFGAPAVVPTRDQAEGILLRSPVYFEPNLGQFDAEVRFVARGMKYQAWITDSEIVLAFTRRPEARAKFPAPPTERTASSDRELVRIRFGVDNPRIASGLEPLASYSNYFFGKDSKEWLGNAPHYARVKLEDVYPGIDIVFYGKGREIEYDYIVKPGGDPGLISLTLDSVGKPRLDSRGNISIGLRTGEFTHSAPTAFQGDRTVSVGTRLNGNSIKFDVGLFDPARALTIDPVLQFSTYLGGNNLEQDIGAIALDDEGNVFVGGFTNSFNFPTSAPLDPTANGGWDAFVTKLNPDGGGLIYSTYFGGSLEDLASAVAVDAFGNVFVLGRTQSANFPTTVGAFDASANGNRDIFVAKLDPAGSALLYSTLIGGSAEDSPGMAIAIDAAGTALIAGYTRSPNFPTTAGALDTTFNGGYDLFIARLNPTASGLVYSTFLGSTGDDYASSVVGDAPGNAFVSGYTTSPAFPVTPGAYDATFNGGFDGIVAKLNDSGTGLAYSTFLGGASNDFAYGIARSSDGALAVAGETDSADFPVTAGVWDMTVNGSADAFVLKLDAVGDSLVYSTFLGGSSGDGAFDVKLDASGRAYITGYTLSLNFPATADAFDTSPNGSSDAFVAQFSATGGLLYNTLLGGSVLDEGHAIAVDSVLPGVVVAGFTASNNFPAVAGSWDTTYNGSQDAFVARFTIDTDSTPPAITSTVTPGPNSEGWNNGPVTLDWTVADPDSAISSQTGCSMTTVSSETTVDGTLFTCTATSAGGTSSSSVTLRIDLTNPAIAGAATPAPNADGWNNTDVNVTFNCADSLSGATVLSAGILKSAEGSGQTESFTCSDRAGNTASLTVADINIDKTAPVVVSIAVSPDPVPPGVPISVTASLTDGGSGLSQANYQVNGGSFTLLTLLDGASATATGSIDTTSRTISEICVNAVDKAGNVGAPVCHSFSPSGSNTGFVTGGVTFTSPAGAFVGEPAVTGRAQMSLSAKYQGKSAVPGGNNNFTFKAGDLQFSSTSLDWLVVSGARAQYAGKGVFKGIPGVFEFKVTAIDGDMPSGGGPDRIRIRISGAGGVVYDSMMGAPDGAEPTTVIDGGNIVIHK